MKRTLILIITALAVFALVCPAMADKSVEHGKYMVITLGATGEASGNDTLTISGNNLVLVRGRRLVGIETTPGAGALAPSAYTALIEDADGMDVLSVPTRSTTAKEPYPGFSTIGQAWVIKNAWTMTLTGIGEDNTVTVDFIFE